MARLNRDYEAILIIQPESTNEVLSKMQTQFGEIVTRHGGQVLHSAQLGKRKLSYKIGKHTEGIYLQSHFQISPSEVGALQKAVILMDSIVRLMIVQQKSKPSGGGLPTAEGLLEEPETQSLEPNA